MYWEIHVSKVLKISVLATVIAAIAAFGLYKLHRFLVIDGCIDVGGRWIESEGRCDRTIDPAQLSPRAECEYYGGEWDREGGVCVGAVDDPWPPSDADDTREED